MGSDCLARLTPNFAALARPPHLWVPERCARPLTCRFLVFAAGRIRATVRTQTLRGSQYGAIRYAERLLDGGALASIGMGGEDWEQPTASPTRPLA
jgi:hypothetical protein